MASARYLRNDGGSKENLNLIIGQTADFSLFPWQCFLKKGLDCLYLNNVSKRGPGQVCETMPSVCFSFLCVKEI